MNFYESTSFGIRVTTYDLVSISSEYLIIRLIPMVHVGEERYYKEVETYLNPCNYILYEGIRMSTLSLRGRSRRILAKRLGLVTQRKLNLKQFQNRLIHADLDEKSAKDHWKKLSILDRLKSNIFIPIYIYFQDRRLTRKKFVKYFMKSNLDILKINGPMFDKKESLKEYFYKTRDKEVFKKIDKIQERQFKEETIVAIIYGAGHMKSIFRYLTDIYGYKAIKGEFLEVFSI